MKKIFLIILLFPFVLIGQEISPEMFVTPNNTGSNMTIAVNSSSFDPYIGGSIGAFHDNNGDGNLECVGLYDIIDGFFGFPIWGDDSETDELDGLENGGSPYFAILYQGEVLDISLYPPFPGFSQNSINFVDAFYTPISYDLNSGWNLVGYVGSADNNGIEEQINGALHNGSTIGETFQVIKNVSGQFWSPQFAQINEFTQGEGYMMYVTGEPTSLNFQKPSAYNYGIEYSLSAGWNMVAFTGDVNADNDILSSMDMALGDGASTHDTFQVIKNVSGQFWSPQFAQIESFVPGEAYMMYVIGSPTTVNFQR